MLPADEEALRQRERYGGGKGAITEAHRRWREPFPEFIENSLAVARRFR